MIDDWRPGSTSHRAAGACGARVQADGTRRSRSGPSQPGRATRWFEGRLAGLACLLLLWPATAQALPIVAVSGSGQPTGFLFGTGNTGEQILAVSWTATESYTGVEITALLSGSFRGVAYLTTAVGPGTTTAAEIAVSEILVDLSTEDRDDILLFSGLALAPATYFLVLDATDGSSGNWWSEPNLVIVLDMGVSLNDSIASFGAGIDDAFILASSFATVNNGFPFSFAVTGERDEPVSQPATGSMIAAGLAVLAWAGRRRS